MQDHLDSIYRCLSFQRIGKYKRYGTEPIILYKWNVALSEALYPVLHAIEIAVRNRLHQEIAGLLKDQTWLMNRNAYVLHRLNDHWIQKINANLKMLKAKNKLDEGHLVSELSFGFWTALLSGPFEQNNVLWPRLKGQVFPNAHGFNIDYIRKRFDKIRSIRNRVFHYGSIWYWSNLLEQHDIMIDALRWIDPALLHLLEVDRFSKIYANGLVITNKTFKQNIAMFEEIV